MPNIYRIETHPGTRGDYYSDHHGYIYDVTKNGVIIHTHLRYEEARAHVLAVIEDEDRYQRAWKGQVSYDCPGKVEKNPGDVYQIQRRDGYKTDNGSYLCDVTKNGITFLTGVRYSEASAHVLLVIQDHDRYQEVTDGKIECDLSGMHEKSRTPPG